MERGFDELLHPIAQTVKFCRVSEDEKVVIFADTATEKAIVDAFYTAILNVGADPVLVTMKVRPQMLMNPPESAVAAMMEADVVFDLAMKPWLYTEATNRILEGGARMLQCGFATHKTLVERPPDERVLEREQLARRLLESCETFRIFSPLGTDLLVRRGGRRVHTQGGAVDHPGDWDSYGVCVAAFAPPEDQANGKLLLNGTLDINPHERILQQPIEVEVRDGRIARVKEDHADARLFSDWLKSWNDPNAGVIAHTGFGLDHRARLQPPDRSAWESILGGVNVAFGANNIPQLGGKTACKSHLDAILFEASVEVNGKLVIEAGRLLEEEIARAF